MFMQRKNFPSKLLVLPAIAPASVVGLAWLAETMGHHWNVHGDAIYILFLLFVTAFFALITQTTAVSKSIPRLKNYSAERTINNLLCVVFALICIAGAITCIAFMF
jgi:uncharacterized ion transporter superfamily protein YfcC